MAEAQAQARVSPAEAAGSTALLVAAHARASAALRAQTLGMLSHLWLNLGTWHRSDVPRFVPQATRIVDAAQRHMASLTTAYLRRYGDLHGLHVPSPTAPLDVRNGVDKATEYERPFVEVWTALKDGKDLPEAVQQGQNRVENLAATDLQLAKTHTAREVMGKTPGVVGYRRVLEGTYSCGLCIVASTIRYHKGDLMPVHPGCDCGVEEIIGDKDPGRLINAGLLEDVHAAVKEKFGADSTAARKIPGVYNGKGDPTMYRDVIIVHHDGEIGPVLGVRGQDWTGPSDLKTTAPTGG